MALNKLMQITFIPHKNNHWSASGARQNAALGNLAPMVDFTNSLLVRAERHSAAIVSAKVLLANPVSVH